MGLDGQDVREETPGQPRHQASSGHARQGPHAAQKQDLHEVGGEQDAGGSAHALHGRHVREPPAQIPAHPSGDAQAPDQQRAQADQGQIRAQPIQNGADARRGAVEVAHPPAGVGVGGADGFDRARDVPSREPQQVLDAEQAPSLGQARGQEPFRADHETGPQGKKLHDPVRLAHDHAAHLEPGLAGIDLVPHPPTEPGQQSPIDHGSEKAVALGQKPLHVPAAFKLHGPVEGIQGVHALELHQHRRAVGAGHGARGQGPG